MAPGFPRGHCRLVTTSPLANLHARSGDREPDRPTPGEGPGDHGRSYACRRRPRETQSVAGPPPERPDADRSEAGWATAFSVTVGSAVSVTVDFGPE